MEFNRIVSWTGYIDQRGYDHVLGKILKLLDKSKSEPVILWLFSNGGESDVGFAFYDTIQLLKPNLITIGTGNISSIAPIILASGQTRILTQNTILFFHDFLVRDLDRDARLTANLMRTTAGELDNAMENYQRILVEKSKGLLSKEKIHELMNNEITLTANKAVDLGLADMIADLDMFKTK